MKFKGTCRICHARIPFGASLCGYCKIREELDEKQGHQP